MKRLGRLFDDIVARDNLRLAVHKALRGKRDRSEPRAFCARLDDQLRGMAEQLRDGTFPIGRYHQFVIHDPKERVITAPCFAERVLHHAIMNVCEPSFDRRLIHDSYACRKGKGRIKAIERMQHFARRAGYFLKMDVRKYFDSVPHQTLLSHLERFIKDVRLLALFRRIIGAFRPALGRGLPIGSLTSQHFGNFYLSGLDRFVTETLGVKGYVRYMDDVAVWDDDRQHLVEVLHQSEDYLRQEAGLELKPVPYLNRTSHGMDALGCRVFPTHVILGRRARRRFRHKLAALEVAHVTGGIDETELQSRATSLLAFTRAAGVRAFRFRRAVLQSPAASGHRAPTG